MKIKAGHSEPLHSVKIIFILSVFRLRKQVIAIISRNLFETIDMQAFVFVRIFRKCFYGRRLKAESKRHGHISVGGQKFLSVFVGAANPAVRLFAE